MPQTNFRLDRPTLMDLKDQSDDLTTSPQTNRRQSCYNVVVKQIRLLLREDFFGGLARHIPLHENAKSGRFPSSGSVTLAQVVPEPLLQILVV